MTLKDLANGFATLKILSWNFKQSIGARNQIVPARQAGGIHSLESIPGLHKRLKIPALVIKKDQARSIISWKGLNPWRGELFGVRLSPFFVFIVFTHTFEKKKQILLNFVRTSAKKKLEQLIKYFVDKEVIFETNIKKCKKKVPPPQKKGFLN
jgi:hypothetical protein